MSGRIGFTPIIDIGRAVEQATKAAPKRRHRKPTKAEVAFETKSKPTLAEQIRFIKYEAGGLVYGRFAIKLVNGRYEIWDSESHDVFGSFRTYEDALCEARRL
jgi:hypothetical protein